MPGGREKVSLGLLGSVGIQSQDPNEKHLILLGETHQIFCRDSLDMNPKIPIVRLKIHVHSKSLT